MQKLLDSLLSVGARFDSSAYKWERKIAVDAHRNAVEYIENHYPHGHPNWIFGFPLRAHIMILQALPVRAI